MLADFAGVWTPYQTLDELYSDPQVIANGYLPAMEAAPMGSRSSSWPARRSSTNAPGGEPGAEHGEHTEQVLLDAGFDWGAISAMKDSAIL